jgi:hypothetical protein
MQKYIFLIIISTALLLSNIAFAQSSKDAVRALKKLQAKCTVGVSYRDYGNALGDTKFEVDLFLESKKARENIPLTQHVRKAMEYYEGAANIWNVSIISGDHYYVARSSTVRNIIQQYPETSEAIWTPNVAEMFDFGKALSIMWGKASEELEKAVTLLSREEESRPLSVPEEGTCKDNKGEIKATIETCIQTLCK